MATAQQIETVYQARRLKLQEPQGTTDAAGRWTPTPEEDAGITATIRKPSREYPYSYKEAARTRKHAERLAAERPEYFNRLYNDAQQRLHQYLTRPGTPRPTAARPTANRYR